MVLSVYIASTYSGLRWVSQGSNMESGDEDRPVDGRVKWQRETRE